MRLVTFAVAVWALVSCTSSSPEPAASPSPRSSDVVLAACPATSPPEAGVASDLPDLTLPCLGGGEAVHLPGIPARPTVVNIWASWCLPCQREVPALQAVYEDAGRRMTVLGVDIEDTDASAIDFAKHVGMRYPSVVDRKGDVLRRLGFSGPPATVFIDATGEIVHRESGQLTEADLRDRVREHLQVEL